MGLIDLNLDAGESVGALAEGREEKLYGVVSSVNIACGGHAGDAQTMARAVVLAKRHNLNIGAHPSFPDRDGFGRREMKIARQELIGSIVRQISDLRAVCAREEVSLTHVKPHGALYNLAATDPYWAGAVIEAVQKIGGPLKITGLGGSRFLHWCREAGLGTLAEGFADRRYEDDGSLRARSKPGALINDPAACAAQALRLARQGEVRTICIHGDHKNAFAIASAVRGALEGGGFAIGLTARQ